MLINPRLRGYRSLFLGSACGDEDDGGFTRDDGDIEETSDLPDTSTEVRINLDRDLPLTDRPLGQNGGGQAISRGLNLQDVFVGDGPHRNAIGSRRIAGSGLEFQGEGAFL